MTETEKLLDATMSRCVFLSEQFIYCKFYYSKSTFKGLGLVKRYWV